MAESKRQGDVRIDASQHAQHMTGVVGGVGTTAFMRDVTSTVQASAESGSVDPRLKAPLTEGLAALQGLQIADAVKQALAAEYARLAQELKKSAPEKGVLQQCWDTISGFASKAAPLLTLGKLLAEIYGIVTEGSGG